MTRPVRGGDHPLVVAGDGPRAYPGARRLLITADSGGSNGYRVRLWKLGIAAVGRRDRLAHHRLPLPAGYQQVEQDRAPSVLSHHQELARAAVDEPWRRS